jgi:tellurite resistance protein
MNQVADEVARWLGILTTGVLVGADAERSMERAVTVLGEERLGELRAWFASSTKEAVGDAKCAVIEAAIAFAHADHDVAETEREMVLRLVQLAGLDEPDAARLTASLVGRPSLETVAERIPHPALRELTLVIAWQIANADAAIDEQERGLYGELAKRLGIEPARAKALRDVLTS